MTSHDPADDGDVLGTPGLPLLIESRLPGSPPHNGRVPRDDSGVLAGYVSGPAAATEATAVALAKAGGARAVILVEGISDQIAVETLAARRGLDLGADGVVVVPTGGAHGFARYARRFGPQGAGVRCATWSARTHVQRPRAAA